MYKLVNTFNEISCYYPLAKITYKYESTTSVIKIYQFVTETK